MDEWTKWTTLWFQGKKKGLGTAGSAGGGGDVAADGESQEDALAATISGGANALYEDEEAGTSPSGSFVQSFVCVLNHSTIDSSIHLFMRPIVKAVALTRQCFTGASLTANVQPTV